MLTRSEFLALTNLDSESLKNLVRRDQLPFAFQIDQRSLNSYTLFEAYLTILAENLAHPHNGGQSRIRASEIIRNAAPAIIREWARISQTVKTRTEDEIIVGRLIIPGGTVDFCGTDDEIAFHKPTVNIVTTNATRGGWMLAARADDAGIDLGDFWTSVPSA